ncbi:MAG: hypothetical protein NTX97_09610 [Bacteroidetes bacterium]|nr:hypothetical protein [Bacteroidota bacterium]
MKRILFSSLLLVSAVAAITLNSCKKEKPDTETQSAIDNSVCEGEFTGRMGVINGFAIKEQGVKSVMSASPLIEIDPADTLNGFPVTMTLNYGTVGIVDSIDGKTRMGKVQATFDRSWDAMGAVVTVKLINYYVKNPGASSFVQYACDSMMIIHNSLYSFTNNIIGGKCIGSGWNLEWACTRTLTQTAGTGDLNPYNDVFSFTGSATGKNRDGKNYTVNVVTPVVKRVSCSWIESGRIDLIPEGLATRTVDYGTGVCDNQATLTINGNTFAFTMN